MLRCHPSLSTHNLPKLVRALLNPTTVAVHPFAFLPRNSSLNSIRSPTENFCAISFRLSIKATPESLATFPTPSRRRWLVVTRLMRSCLSHPPTSATECCLPGCIGKVVALVSSHAHFLCVIGKGYNHLRRGRYRRQVCENMLAARCHPITVTVWIPLSCAVTG